MRHEAANSFVYYAIRLKLNGLSHVYPWSFEVAIRFVEILTYFKTVIHALINIVQGLRRNMESVIGGIMYSSNQVVKCGLPTSFFFKKKKKRFNISLKSDGFDCAT